MDAQTYTPAQISWQLESFHERPFFVLRRADTALARFTTLRSAKFLVGIDQEDAWAVIDTIDDVLEYIESYVFFDFEEFMALQWRHAEFRKVLR